MSASPPLPRPVNGSRWQHYQGGFHSVVCIAQRRGNAEPQVVHRAALGGLIWITPLTEWHAMVGRGQRRFTPADAAGPPEDRR